MIFFLIWQKTALNQMSSMILEVQIQIFGARAAKFSLSKIPGGLNINIFGWKSTWSFLLHWRTNTEKQIRNLSFKNYHFGPQKKRVFGFWWKTHKKIFSLCFGFESALKTIDAEMSFWSVFLKTPSKTPFWPFLAVINFF